VKGKELIQKLESKATEIFEGMTPPEGTPEGAKELLHIMVMYRIIMGIDPDDSTAKTLGKSIQILKGQILLEEMKNE